MEKELSDICSSILQLLDDHLIPTASSGESKVFYLKMKGDYHRYLAEFKTGSDRKDAAEHTLLAYKAAQVRVLAPEHCCPLAAFAFLPEIFEGFLSGSTFSLSIVYCVTAEN